jgi:uncharacterized protein DUF4331
MRTPLTKRHQPPKDKEIPMKTLRRLALAAVLMAAPFAAHAADHAEAPLVEADQAADIADVYAFLDPSDNTRAILAFDVHGFIVPGENANLGAFDPDVLFRFEIENTGDAVPDRAILVRFSKQTSRSQPQTATVTMTGARGSLAVSFTAPTTVSSSTLPAANAPVVTTDPVSGISFFAGLRDDPFFFDIPAFNRFVGSVLGGSADPSLLSRGRDTFAGYNINMIALSVPVSLLKGSAGDVIGVGAATLRHRNTHLSQKGDPVDAGDFVQIDRMGVPAINTALIPFARKDEYNRARAGDDANGKFATDIVGALTALGTNSTNIGILADVAVTHGDLLRLDTSVANSGPQGGTSAGAGFPNGRRPTDDVIDTILFLVTNGALTTGDNVSANDSIFGDAFPFFAQPHQPLATGTVDDNTRN